MPWMRGKNRVEQMNGYLRRTLLLAILLGSLGALFILARGAL